MRWQALFADLEAEAQALEVSGRAVEIDERARAEIGQLRLTDRLRAARGMQVHLSCAAGLNIAGSLARTGPDWVLVSEASGGEYVIALSAVLTLAGLGRYSAVPDSEGVVESRLLLRHVLRGVGRDRSAVRVYLTSGAWVDATIDRTGADFIEVAAHAPGEARRRDQVKELRTIPIGAVACVRRGVTG